MARTGGRNSVFAWFVGGVSAVVVVALIWFAAPAFPAVAVWIGGLFRGDTSAPEAAPSDAPLPTPEPSVTAVARPADCAALYSEPMAALLASTAGAEQGVGAGLPATAETTAPAIGADDLLVCVWTIPTGASVVTVVGTVGPDAADALTAALGSEQFACTSDGVVAHCERELDGRVEVHDTREGLWVVSVMSGWHPPGYAESVTEQIWG